MRRIPTDEVTSDTLEGPLRPSSASFLQDGPDGDVSVYLESETTADKILEKYPGNYVARLSVGTIRDQGLEVERDDKLGDPGHCNIKGHKTRGKLRSIAKASEWVEGYGPPAP